MEIVCIFETDYINCTGVLGSERYGNREEDKEESSYLKNRIKLLITTAYENLTFDC